MKNNSEPCRESFENEIKNTYAFKNNHHPILARNEAGSYYNIITQSRWELWQKAWNASRITQGIKVKLNTKKVRT
ncbi:hypothetical protein PSI19_03295 [Xenorhabdus khoisanae]|uniref:hypothetical protein n=1 Tax=Xenorhabdus khoisanae TaxID=880157 RepID=UPI0023590928|nr:hypothetical protein [Xenorhabdus khoisanae]MDC9612923.1 hypothetical protein [Xenorhabdus khoisanae]